MLNQIALSGVQAHLERVGTLSSSRASFDRHLRGVVGGYRDVEQHAGTTRVVPTLCNSLRHNLVIGRRTAQDYTEGSLGGGAQTSDEEILSGTEIWGTKKQHITARFSNRHRPKCEKTK